MALARPTLDETSGVQLDLEADGLPAGVNAMSDAEGVGTHPPAFDGVLTVMLGAQAFEVPVISVDDVVYAQLPLVPGAV